MFPVTGVRQQKDTLQRTFWLSYDLWPSGDYEGLYSWLDNRGARECGSSVALVRNYEFERDLSEELEADIRGTVALNRRSRIYVIWRNNGKMRGRYLVGKRRIAPWTGFGDDQEQEADEA